MSDCNVCLYSSGEYADLSFTKIVKGRKDYQCSECNQPIPKGTLHQYWKGFQEGDWWTYRTCLICAEIRKAFSCDGEELGGTFWSELAEVGFPEMNTGCLNRLQTPEAKAYLLQRWNEWRFANA